TARDGQRPLRRRSGGSEFSIMQIRIPGRLLYSVLRLRARSMRRGPDASAPACAGTEGVPRMERSRRSFQLRLVGKLELQESFGGLRKSPSFRPTNRTGRLRRAAGSLKLLPEVFE